MADNMIAAMLRASMPGDRPIQAQCMAQGAEEIERLSSELAEANKKVEVETIVNTDLIAKLRATREQLAEKQRVLDGIGLAESLGWAQLEDYRIKLAESERVSAARNQLNGKLAMENERLRERIAQLECDCGGTGVVEGTNANSGTWYPCKKCAERAALTASASGGAT
jgi:hypothetical protein